MRRLVLVACAWLTACGRWGFDDERLPGDGQDVEGDAADTGDGDATDAPPVDAALVDASITPGTSVFGTTTVGGSTQNSSTNRVWMSKFTVPDTGTLQRLVVYFGTGGGQGSTVRGVIYADAASTPTTLRYETIEVTIPGQSAATWVALPLAAPAALAPGTYWIGTHNDSAIQLAYQTSTGGTKFTGDTYADGADASWAGGGTTFAMQISIYAEYTVP